MPPPIWAGIDTILEGNFHMPAILLWLLGVPIPVIILLILLFHG
jgi:hypothetical protein